MSKIHLLLIGVLLTIGVAWSSQIFTEAHAQVIQSQVIKADSQRFIIPARFSIRVRSASGKPVDLKVAIGFDETLELFQTGTPFEFEFTASQYTALISTTTPGASLVAEEWSDVRGEFRKMGGFAGGAVGKFTFNPHGPNYGFAGTRF